MAGGGGGPGEGRLERGTPALGGGGNDTLETQKKQMENDYNFQLKSGCTLPPRGHPG